MDNSNNITFFLEEKQEDKNNNEDIQKMMDEFTSLENDQEMPQYMDNLNSLLYNNKLFYSVNDFFYDNNEEFYEKEYTIKDLLKICNYYGLDKDIKMSKCKKQDIIDTIVYFESLPENMKTVQQRNKMWEYMSKMLLDPKMKKLVIFL